VRNLLFPNLFAFVVADLQVGFLVCSCSCSGRLAFTPTWSGRRAPCAPLQCTANLAAPPATRFLVGALRLVSRRLWWSNPVNAGALLAQPSCSFTMRDLASSQIRATTRCRVSCSATIPQIANNHSYPPSVLSTAARGILAALRNLRPTAIVHGRQHRGLFRFMQQVADSASKLSA